MLDLESILSDLDQADIEEVDGSRIQRTFIGTVFSLSPSGKYYQPFACSNLDPCPNCNGSGYVRVKGNSLRKFKKADSRLKKMLRINKSRHGSNFLVDWPEDVKEKYLDHARRVNKAKLTTSCDRCDGLGSHEAADDARWQEQVEEQLSNAGLWLESGEGDPCDLFVGRCLPDLDEEEEDFDFAEEEDSPSEPALTR